MGVRKCYGYLHIRILKSASFGDKRRWKAKNCGKGWVEVELWWKELLDQASQFVGVRMSDVLTWSCNFDCHSTAVAFSCSSDYFWAFKMILWVWTFVFSLFCQLSSGFHCVIFVHPRVGFHPHCKWHPRVKLHPHCHCTQHSRSKLHLHFSVKIAI